ncbi:MAG: C40 family peptidase [Candidatus Daviesbacteria bacterium]|nr:MAG: C40 family peptidase [Candidatus Daviesbacteria bacterium]
MDHASILKQAYQQFILPLGGKQVFTPYRINIPFQPDRRKYGKSSPEKLIKNTLEIAREQNFDLNQASVEEIRKFMEQNQLGIDCSGFVYYLLDYLLKKIGQGGMEEAGFPPASKTNVAILTSEEFSNPVEDFSQIQPGDLIKLNSKEEIPHVVIILDSQNEEITYAHSSSLTPIKGIHQDSIKNSQFPAELEVFSYNKQMGDGIRRLKILA